MPQEKEKLERLKKLLEVANEGLSREEFLNAFQHVIKLIVEIEKKLVGQANEVVGDLKNLMSEFKRESDKLSSMLENRVDSKLGAIKDGLNGKDGKDGKPGKDGKDGKDGKSADEQMIINTLQSKLPKVEEIISKIPIEGERIRDSLELLNGDERLDAKYIKGLEEKFKTLEQRIMGIAGKSMGKAKVPIVRPINLTSQVDGATTDFTLDNDVVRVLGVWSTQFPVTFDDANDFTHNGRTLTINTGTVQSGQTLWALCECLFYP